MINIGKSTLVWFTSGGWWICRIYNHFRKHTPEILIGNWTLVHAPVEVDGSTRSTSTFGHILMKFEKINHLSTGSTLENEHWIG